MAIGITVCTPTTPWTNSTGYERSIASAPAAPPWVAVDAFNAVEAQRIIECCQRFDEIDATIEGDPQNGQQLNKAIRHSRVRAVPRDARDSYWFFARLDKIISAINEKYYDFNLDSFNFLQFSEYPVAGHFALHMDLGMGRGGPSRKLSITLTLNDDFEGGEFKIQAGPEPHVVHQAVGRLIAFPSFILHSVLPVTKGVRKSVVVWVTGVPFS